MPGIITIAAGEKRYIEMAKMLALSLKRVNPELQRAVITDAPEAGFDGLFDLFIPYNPGFGPGLSQKLHLDKYSPFEETLFIDADCLAFKPLDDMIRLCGGHSFAVFGGQIDSGEWYMDVAEMCLKFGVPSIPLFNGGTYYFKRSGVVTDIYDTARDLLSDYDSLGFKAFRGSINEEPLIAIAMAMNNVEAVDDAAKGMRTPIGLAGPLDIDILQHKCTFDKEGELAEPAILHFSGSFSNAFHYKREVGKLKLANAMPLLNTKLVSVIIDVIYNVPYAIYVFTKRIAKVVLRRQKFNFTNPLPAFSNQ